MKKSKNSSLIFYIVSILFYVAAIITFLTGNHNSTGTIWLCCGSTFLCLGSSWRKKKESKAEKQNNAT